MKKLILLAVLFSMGTVNVWAWNCPQVVSPTTAYSCTTTVFNDSGAALASGSVVVWDTDDTEFDRSGAPQVTTTTTDDLIWVAGVMVTGSTPDQGLGEMVVYGWAKTLIADATDAVTEDLLVGTSGVAAMAGDYTVGADTAALGTLIEARDLDGGGDDNTDGQYYPVWVDVDRQ